MDFERANDDQMLPKATIDKIVSLSVPKALLVAKESKEFFQSSCIEFLRIVTIRANKICENEKKKTISHLHIYQALEDYGFSTYVDQCKKVHDDYDKYIKQKPSKIDKFKDSGLSLEELHEQQQQLFQNAKAQFNKSLEDDNEEIK